MKPVKAEPKVSNPQSKGEIAGTYSPVDQSYGAYQPEAQPIYPTYYNKQEEVPLKPANTTANHTDYTDEIEREAVEGENTLDTEAEKDLVHLEHYESRRLPPTKKQTEFTDLLDPSNPLFGKYDVPAPSRMAFCPPCGKLYHCDLQKTMVS